MEDDKHGTLPCFMKWNLLWVIIGDKISLTKPILLPESTYGISSWGKEAVTIFISYIMESKGLKPITLTLRPLTNFEVGF